MNNLKIAAHDPFAALRVREFLFFLNTRFFLSMAIQIQAVTIGWQIYQHTRDELALGLIGLAEAIPFIAASLFSGHVADTYNRKYIVVISATLLTICATTLFYFSLQTSNIITTYGVAPFFIVVCFIGVIRGFLAAALPSFMSQIVPRTLYGNASTWNSTIWHFAAVLGPAIAGFMCATNSKTINDLNFKASYQLSVMFMIMSVISFLFIASKPLTKKDTKETFKHSLLAGIKFVSKNELILGALSLDLFAVLFGGAVAMLPVFADTVLHIDSVELGFLSAAPAVGAVIMAIVLAYKPPTKNAGKNLLVSVAGFGICIILFGISTNYYLSLFFLFLTGAFDSVSVVLRQTILQLSTPDEMRGRVSAVNSIFIGSSNEIGAAESGGAAHAMGLKASVVFGGTMTILVVLATSKLAPKLRKLNLTSLQ
jgi:MFS family permease